VPQPETKGMLISETARSTSKVWKAARRLVVLAVTFGSSWIVPNAGRAQVKTWIPSAEAGRIGYEKYCTPCHGPGGAPGSAVYRNTKQPIDLRTYVQRHGGQFPLGKWLAVVFSSQPRGPHTEVWEKIRSAQQTPISSSDANARDLVDAIENYIILVQTE